MKYLPLIVLMLGCAQPVPVEVPQVEVQYVDLVKTVTTSSDEIKSKTDEISTKLGEQTAVLLQIKALVENPPAGGTESPEPPSSPSQPVPPAPPSQDETVKPTLYVSTIKYCEPCKRLKKDIEAGKFSDFDIVYLDDDTWTQGFPVIRWKEDGKWMYFTNGKGKNRGYDKNILKDLKQRFGINQTTSAQTYQHSDLVQLHNDLHGGGSWTWPGDLTTHLRRDHGVEL